MSDPVFGLPSRRSFLKLGGLAVGGLALAACAGTPAATSTATGGTATAEKKGVGNNGQVGKGRAGTAGDTMFIAGHQWGPPANFNPLAPTAAWPATGNNNQYIYETALRWTF